MNSLLNASKISKPSVAEATLVQSALCAVVGQSGRALCKHYRQLSPSLIIEDTASILRPLTRRPTVVSLRSTGRVLRTRPWAKR